MAEREVKNIPFDVKSQLQCSLSHHYYYDIYFLNSKEELDNLVNLEYLVFREISIAITPEAIQYIQNKINQGVNPFYFGNSYPGNIVTIANLLTKRFECKLENIKAIDSFIADYKKFRKEYKIEYKHESQLLADLFGIKIVVADTNKEALYIGQPCKTTALGTKLSTLFQYGIGVLLNKIQNIVLKDTNGEAKITETSYCKACDENNELTKLELTISKAKAHQSEKMKMKSKIEPVKKKDMNVNFSPNQIKTLFSALYNYFAFYFPDTTERLNRLDPQLRDYITKFETSKTYLQSRISGLIRAPSIAKCLECKKESSVFKLCCIPVCIKCIAKKSSFPDCSACNAPLNYDQLLLVLLCTTYQKANEEKVIDNIANLIQKK